MRAVNQYYRALNRGTAPPPIPSFSNFGSFAGTLKWESSSLGLNGKIYGCPRASGNVLEIDPSTSTASLKASKTGQYLGSCTAPNGKIYHAPISGGQVMVYNPATNTVTYIGSGLSTYASATLANDGKIYCFPAAAANILVIDPTTDTISSVGSFAAGGFKYVGSVLAPNGDVYGVPFGATVYAKLNITTSVVSTFGTVTGGGGSAFYGATLGLDNLIYFFPHVHPKIVVIDPTTDSVSQLSETIGGTGGQYSGGQLLPSGEILLVGYAIQNFRVLNIGTGLTTAYPQAGMVGSGLRSATLATNGKAYATPFYDTKVWEISNIGSITPDMYTMPIPISGLSVSLYNKHQNKL